MIDRNRILPALFGKSISYDYYVGKSNPKDTVIFIPGFKGFKDWGPWDLVARIFAEGGFNFIKANLSHNGIDINKNENEITDLIAFANNCFSIELDDISRLVSESQWLSKGGGQYLIGHSRGGALSILSASHDPRIDAVISWASPSDFEDHFFAADIPRWEEEGVYHIKNNRNGQDLPLRYHLYQDYVLNHDRLHIPSRAEKITQPFLAIHGDEDETVPVTALEVLKRHCPQVKTHLVKEADHTFGARHPWTDDALPIHLQEVVMRSLEFLNELPTRPN